MATAIVEKQTAQLRLNDGTTASGGIRTVNVSLGSLEASKWDPDKALTIAEALERCLSKTISSFAGTTVSTYRAD